MNAPSLHYYLERLPADISLTGEKPTRRRTPGIPEHRCNEIERYATVYSSPQAAWLLIQGYIRAAQNGVRLPPHSEWQDDTWFRQAYDWCVHKIPDNAVSHAVMLLDEKMTYERQVIDALLLTPDSTIESVASRLALSQETVACYEQLFFNVIDRRHEALYIGRNVYPQTRLVEMMEGYIESEGLGMLLRRAGFNNGVQHVLHAAGLASGTGLLVEMNGNQAASDLESLLMANGYFLARNGWINQRRHAHGLAAARGLISAAKASGQATGSSASLMTLHGVGDSIRTELIEAGRRQIPGDTEAMKLADVVGG